MDCVSLSGEMGTVLYVGDDGDELFALAMTFDNPNLYGVVDGLNYNEPQNPTCGL